MSSQLSSQQANSNRSRGRASRSFYWPGFFISFILLSILSVGGLAMASGLGNLSLADLQNEGPAWIPPSIAPTLEAGPQTETDSTDLILPGPGVFGAEEQVRNVTNSRVNIRLVPGYLSKPAGDVVAQLLPGETVTILGDRAAVDNLVWWQIRYVAGDGRAIDGWIAEATASGVQILGK